MRFSFPLLVVTSLLLSGLKAPAEGQPRTLGDYSVGDRIESEIVTPFPLVVFNPVQTEILRKAEARKATPVFRHDSLPARDAEAAMRARFSEAHETFLRLLEKGFQTRTLRHESELKDPRFAEAILVFRSQVAGFPLTANLAELWALGDSGIVVLDDLTTKLRRFMNAHLRVEKLPPGENLAVGSIRIVYLDSNGARSNTNRAVTIARPSLYSMGRFKQEIGRVTPPEEKPLVDFVLGFLRPNCSLDVEATGVARERRVQAINAVDRYDSGQIVARAGQIVDLSLKLALDELRSRLQKETVETDAARLRIEMERLKTESARREAEMSSDQRAALVVASAAKQAAADARQRNRSIWAGFGAASFACLTFAGMWWRHRRRYLCAGTAVIIHSGSGLADSDEPWRERALAAEARAEKATRLIRGGMMPLLARWLSHEFVRRLLAQRSADQSAQQQAEGEVAELAARLDSLHAPLEERLLAYERRIVELETELAARDRQDQELIKARIESTRRKLDRERSHDAPAWN